VNFPSSDFRTFFFHYLFIYYLYEACDTPAAIHAGAGIFSQNGMR
jgi:hypothetical protein